MTEGILRTGRISEITRALFKNVDTFRIQLVKAEVLQKVRDLYLVILGGENASFGLGYVQRPLD